MPGFLSRFRRIPENAPSAEPETDAAGAALFKGEVVGIEPGFESAPDDSLPDKISVPDLEAEGNEVAIESIELAHKGFDAGRAADVTPGQLIDDLAPASPAAPTGPIADVLYSAAGNSGDAPASPEFTLFKPDGTPLRGDDDEAQSTLVRLAPESDAGDGDVVIKGKKILSNATEEPEYGDASLEELD